MGGKISGFFNKDHLLWLRWHQHRFDCYLDHAWMPLSPIFRPPADKDHGYFTPPSSRFRQVIGRWYPSTRLGKARLHRSMPPDGWNKYKLLVNLNLNFEWRMAQIGQISAHNWHRCFAADTAKSNWTNFNFTCTIFACVSWFLLLCYLFLYWYALLTVQGRAVEECIACIRCNGKSACFKLNVILKIDNIWVSSC